MIYPTMTTVPRDLYYQESAYVRRLCFALEESVRLQSHYASLLNAYDGGTRLEFANADAWLARLEDVAK